MLLDIKTFKPTMSLELINKQNPIDKDVFNIKEIKRLKELDNYSKRLDYYIRKSDIDLNNHVHNLNYLDMALEVIDDKYYSNIEIEYLKEIKYDDKIIVMSEKTNDKYYIKIYNETNNVTSALIEIY
jgi:acyl-ACP thioesterase